MAVMTASLLLIFPTGPLQAQLPGGAGNGPSVPPAVFLDCQSRPNCNQTQFQSEITFVNWVRDRVDSDVHVIFTSQPLGGGGRQFTLDFVGRRALEGLNDQLTFMAEPQHVDAEIMDGLARTLRIGLLRYAVQTGMGRSLDVRFTAPRTGTAGVSENGATLEDPWNQWSFRLSVSGDMDFRETRTSSRINPQFDADRVTDDWKLNFQTRLDLRRARRDLADGRSVRDDRNDWRLTGLIVKSLGDHMGIGVDTDFRNSVQRNQELRARVNPAVEYNYFPYAEATRRQFIAHYSVGVEHSEYVERTIFGVDRETLPLHRIGIQYRVREEWGNAGLGLDANQYLHDAGFYAFGVSSDLNYRILRGLELSVSAGASITNDNFYTPAGDISDGDILLGRQSLPSSYRYEASMGLSYRWGSPFASVVNNRFPWSVRW